MTTNRFTLEPYHGSKSRYSCPECHRHKTFSRYIDVQTGEHIADHVGRCDREVNCAYHFTPAQYFASQPGARSVLTAFSHGPSTTDFGQNYRPLTYKDFEPSYLPACLIRLTVKHYQSNNLVHYLAAKFGQEAAYTLAKLYLLGTSKHWPGASIFWQVDSAGKVRTGKIMRYNAETGKRVKEPFNHIAWAHKVLRTSESRKSPESPKVAANASFTTLANNLPDFRTPGLSDFNLKQCLFGEHLLQYEPGKPVAICESEKTAMISSVYYPELIWLAAGSLQGLNACKCHCLAGRTVILVPDANAYEQWAKKAAQLSAALSSVSFRVMRLLEHEATEQQRQEGWDVADYL